VKGERAVLALAMCFPTIMAYFYFSALGDSPAAAEPSPAVRLVYALGKLAQFALPVVWIAWAERRWPRPARPPGRGLLIGIGFGLAVGCAGLAIYFLGLRHSTLAASAAAKIHGKVMEMGLETPARYVFFATFMAVVHSLLEEYYWRWFVFGRLCRHWPAAALPLSSLAFMAHHVIIIDTFFPGRFWEMTMPLSLAIAVGGGVWAWLYSKSQSIYAPWASHALVDAAIMAVGYDLVFGGT
jgi:membrane protease YdiL (CAAX protease family)